MHSDAFRRARWFSRSLCLAGLLLCGGWRADAVPAVQITSPVNQSWYGTAGINRAEGTATADPGLTIGWVYCMLYWYAYNEDNYQYHYWNWTSRTWQIGSSDETLRLADGTTAWSIEGGFPAEFPVGLGAREYALYARAYDTAHPPKSAYFGANVSYFYIDDGQAPVIRLWIQQPVLSPADGELVQAAQVGVYDGADAAPEVSIVITSSDRPKPGKKARQPDWQVVEQGGLWFIWLRAEKDQRKVPRVYTITVQATDHAGNQAQASGTVTVP